MDGNIGTGKNSKRGSGLSSLSNREFGAHLFEVAVAAVSAGGLWYAVEQLDFSKSFAVVCKYLHQPNSLKGDLDLDALALGVMVALSIALALRVSVAAGPRGTADAKAGLRKALDALLYACSGAIALLACTAVASWMLPLLVGGAKHTAGQAAASGLLSVLAVFTILGMASTIACARPGRRGRSRRTCSGSGAGARCSTGRSSLWPWPSFPACS